MKTVYIIYKQSDIKAEYYISDITLLLQQAGYTIECFFIDELPPLQYSPSLTLLALGGDGTILNLVYHNRNARLPIISINSGTLGFFTTFSLDSWKEGLITTLEAYDIEMLPLLHVHSASDTDIALNEVSVTRSGIARNIFIEVFINNEKTYAFSGDGILVATQYGSSAYARSLGGSLIHPHLDACIIAPIIPSSPALPPIIIPFDSKIVIQVATDNATITCDGQRCIPFTNTIIIEKATYAMPFISFLKNKSYYSHLHTKGIL